MKNSTITTMLTTQESMQRFPIRILSEKTGVGTSTLRAWERRYGLMHPARTPKGHRLYNAQDARRVLKILDLLNDGHSLPAIAQMLAADITADASTASVKAAIAPASTPAETSEMSDIWQNFIRASMDSTSDFNIERIDAIYNEATSLYPIEMVTEQLILPTLQLLGDIWLQHPERGIAQEHFYTSWLKNRIGARFHHAYSHARGARIVCACVPGNYHEIGLMLFSLSALARGYRVLYFGADLPLNQLPYIAERSAARALVLSLPNHAHNTADQSINQALIRLPSEISTPVFIGGSDQPLDSEAFQAAGGILLGANISVAIRVFESHIPVYPIASSRKR
ncbi:MAG: MerR family transcriptional regulator [Gammaproteobacteria bacterium]|nr:MerR family transcriptional regulator [Gammaproteobacteria bacterium]MBL6999297.1 MerR family transcriptional regulator [Gammaproteobacteria bacterium]